MATQLDGTVATMEVAPAALATRFLAFFIDALVSIPLQIVAAVPVVGIIGAPLLCAYWLSRDSFFRGQSLGKKLMGIRVVRTDSEPFTWTDSCKRNIIAFAILLEMLPFIGFIGLAVSLLGSFADIVLVLATNLRIGDRIASTRVIAA